MPVKHFLIKGRVQGVGFRWFAHRVAAEIGLRGWVRNTDTGHVELLACGSENQLDQLAVELKNGSRGSRVDAIIEHTLDDAEDVNLTEFQIEGAW